MKREVQDNGVGSEGLHGKGKGKYQKWEEEKDTVINGGRRVGKNEKRERLADR